MFKYLVSPILGAVVGYFTNWLAIKMLFKPYEEKRLMGIKLPFTPGLIFKQRYKISEKIGQVVENYILTNDVIEQYASSDENKKKLYNNIDLFFKNIEKKDYTFEEVLRVYFSNDCDEILNNFEKNICEIIHCIINSDETDKKVIEISDFIIDELKNKFVKEFDTEKCFNFVHTFIKKNCIDKYADDFIDNKLPNIRPSDIFDKNKYDKIEEEIRKRVPVFCSKLESFLNSNVYINDKLYEITEKLIDENVGTFASIFINSKKVYLSIKDSFLDYINSDEGQETIENKIISFINENYELTLQEIINKIPEDLEINAMQELKNKELIIKIFNDMSELLRVKLTDKEFNSTIENFYPKFKPKVKDSINNIWKENVKIYIIKRAGIFSNIIIKHIKLFKINNIMLKFKNLVLNKQNYEKIWTNIIEKGSNKIIKHTNISSIVENRINEFDMRIIEELTLSIVKKELNAITFFGGILGFIIGLIPVIINLFNG